MGRRRNPLTLLVGMEVGTATLENSVEVPQKVETRATLWPSNCTTGYLPPRYKRGDLKGHLHPNVYSSSVRNSQTMEKAQMPTDRWLDKDVVYICMYTYTHTHTHTHTHTMEYYSAIKRNEILPFAMTRMELKSKMLNKRSQSEKTNTIQFHSCRI